MNDVYCGNYSVFGKYALISILSRYMPIIFLFKIMHFGEIEIKCIFFKYNG